MFSCFSCYVGSA